MASAIQAAKAAFSVQKSGQVTGADDWEDKAETRLALQTTHKPTVPAVRTLQLKLKPEPSKPERYHQQKLSFASVATKRSSLDSLSRNPPAQRPASSTSLSSSDRRVRHDEPSALRHKTSHREAPLSSPSLSASSRPRPKLSAPPSFVSRASHSSSSQRLSTIERQRGTTEPKPRVASSFPATTKLSPTKNFALFKFVDQLEEKKAAPATTLNEYLVLDRKQKGVIDQVTRPSGRGGDACGRWGAADKWRQDRERYRGKQKQTPTPSSGSKGSTSRIGIDGYFLHSTAEQPLKRQSLHQPRSVPDRYKSPLRSSTLSFIVAPTVGGTGPSVRTSRDDDGDNDSRKRKRSSDFTSPRKQPNKVRR